MSDGSLLLDKKVLGEIKFDSMKLKLIYSFWLSGIHNNISILEISFKSAPFNGEFIAFGGLEELLLFIENFKINAEVLEIIKSPKKNS